MRSKMNITSAGKHLIFCVYIFSKKAVYIVCNFEIDMSLDIAIYILSMKYRRYRSMTFAFFPCSKPI